MLAALFTIAVVLTAAVVGLAVAFLRTHPRARLSEQREAASMAVAAAEQVHRDKDDGSNPDRARDVTRCLMELRPELNAATCRMLVEWAVAEKRSPKP